MNLAAWRRARSHLAAGTRWTGPPRPQPQQRTQQSEPASGAQRWRRSRGVETGTW